MSSWYLQSAKFSLDFQIEMQESAIKALEYIYSDGNYGLLWKAMISSCYGLNSLFYYRKGDYDNTLHSLRKAAKLAVNFDSLDKTSTMHSPLFEGHSFNKDTWDRDYIATKQLKHSLLNDYGFSDDFKSSAEFKEIIAMLG